MRHSAVRGARWAPLLVEAVTLQVVGVPPMLRPLNVTAPAGAARDYTTNPYRALFGGQGPGARLPADYKGVPGGHVELAPNETDQLDIQVAAAMPAEVQYRVQVTYRVANEAQEHTLTLAQTFTVVFSDSTNWHPFSIQDGRFVAAN